MTGNLGQFIFAGQKAPQTHASQTYMAQCFKPGVFIPHFVLINRPTPIIVLPLIVEP